jgi:hypothetical protein
LASDGQHFDRCHEIAAICHDGLFRGICCDADLMATQYQDGRRVRFTAFTSTTSDVLKAYMIGWGSKRWCPDHFKVLVFQLRVRSAVSLSAYSLYPAEEELLIRPWVRFVVASHRMVACAAAGPEDVDVYELVEPFDGNELVA